MYGINSYVSMIFWILYKLFYATLLDVSVAHNNLSLGFGSIALSVLGQEPLDGASQRSHRRVSTLWWRSLEGENKCQQAQLTWWSILSHSTPRTLSPWLQGLNTKHETVKFLCNGFVSIHKQQCKQPVPDLVCLSEQVRHRGPKSPRKSLSIADRSGLCQEYCKYDAKISCQEASFKTLHAIF